MRTVINKLKQARKTGSRRKSHDDRHASSRHSGADHVYRLNGSINTILR